MRERRNGVCFALECASSRSLGGAFRLGMATANTLRLSPCARLSVGSMSEDLFSQSFDHLLAFVLPGLGMLWGLSYFDPNGLGAWFRTASTSETSIGGFLFLVLAALAMGVFISGVRWLLLENWLHLFPSPPELNEAKRREQGVREAHADARHHHFYYFLFYGNMLCAMPVVLIGWKWARDPEPAWSTFIGAVVGFVLIEGVLYRAAYGAISRFKTKIEQIVGFKP